MKKVFIALPFIAIVAIISASTFWIGKNAAKSKSQRAEIVDCQNKGEFHAVEIKNNQAIPALTKAKLCDKLTIVNKDDKLRLMAFGNHNAHIKYNGITEKTLKKDESLSVTLNQAGTYIFHDHLQEEVGGQFIVQ